MKTRHSFVCESLNNDQLYIVIPTGLGKPWLTAIEKAIKLVPKEAVPNQIGTMAVWKKSTGRKVTARELGSNYAVTLKSSSLFIPLKFVTQEHIAKRMEKYTDTQENLEFGIKYNKGLTFSYHDFDRDFQIVGINTKNFKSPNDIEKSKADANSKIKTHEVKNGRWVEREKPKENLLWSLNHTGVDTLVHEFGHVFDNRRYISGSSGWKSVFDKWRFDFKTEFPIPERLKNSASEAWADAFANVIVYNGIQLPDYVRQYVKSQL